MSLFRRNPNEVNYVGENKHYIDTIKNSGDGNLLVWRQPEEDFNINSCLIVNPGEEAIFIKNGIVVSTFSNGRYELETENYPFLSRLRNALSGGVSTFNCVVYFFRKAHSMEILWGTSTPIQLRDPVQQIATSVRANGSYKIQVDNCGVFLEKMLGNNVQFLDQDYIYQYFSNQFQQKIKSTLARALKNSKEEILGVCSEMELFAEEITPFIQEIFEEYGLRLVNFSISSITIPEDDPNRQHLEEAYAKSREFDIMGNKYHTIKSMGILENISNNPGAGGIASAGAGLGMGIAAGGMLGDLTKSMFAPVQANQQQSASQGDNAPISNNGNDDCMEKLAKLKKMLEMELIEQAEYDAMKKDILQKMML